MEFSYTPEQEAFRAELREWLAKNMPEGWKGEGRQALEDAAPEELGLLRDWLRTLHKGGWSGLHWPVEYGGRGAGLVEQVIFNEELARARAPRVINGIGLELVGPTMIAYGSEEQKKQHLPKILAGEEIWCQGFSEPNAGSDLAGLQTRADLDGDEFVVNGSKIWTSGAQYSEWCGLLARTDQDAPKHRGISFLLVDMKSPGIRVQPVRQMTGDAGFNQVFFEDVRVPRENLMGELNRGWYIAQNTLGFERGPITLSFYIAYKQTFDDLLKVARDFDRNGAPALADPVLRQRIAGSYIDLEILRLNGYRMLTDMLHGQLPGADVSPPKLHWGQADQRLHELAVDLLGPFGQLLPGDRHAAGTGYFGTGFLSSRSATIYGGTAQIQRNIVAERLLGLPR
jgi:alkylation response protein AidB-like acyl-CoA dehydrogenase